MEWDAGRAQAAFEALDGAFPGEGIVVAVAAVSSGSSEPAFGPAAGPSAGWTGDRGVITLGSR
jgi:hypothetical protein